MRIVDVCAFYTPSGGGVRTYVDAKLRAAPRLGHELIVVAPGPHEEVVRIGPGAFVATIPSPPLPVDRRYRYFNDESAIHRALDFWNPDHVEVSSPWSSATMVGRWQGSATRSLLMHSDPLAAYAYRWLGGIASIGTIDGWFEWFWKHLRGLGSMFDAVVCANSHLADRLSAGGVLNAETVRLGVEADLFSPALRSQDLRAAALEALGLDDHAILLLAIGRFSAEKRWEMVAHAVGECARRLPVGLILVGDGPKRHRLEILADRYPTIAVLPRVDDRNELARLLASGDALVHGCESETFCLVAAEARASGIPLIVPDRGAAADQLVHGAGTTYRAGRERSLEQAIAQFVERGPELQRAAAARASRIRTMNDHFAELFARYEQLVHVPATKPDLEEAGIVEGGLPLPGLAVARSAVRLR
jgi:alpha-1,6-mannosyltransferase